MSNYFPKTMSKWKMHKRSNDSQLNSSFHQQNATRHPSFILHSLSSSMLVPSQGYEKHGKTDRQNLKTQKMRTVTSRKEQRLSHAMLFNCRSSNTEQKQHRSNTSLFGRHSSYSYRKRSQRKKDKDHKQRQLQTLENLQQLGLNKILVVSRQKLSSNRSALNQVQEIQEMQESFVTQIKETSVSRVLPYQKKSKQGEETLGYEETERVNKESTKNEEQEYEEKFFLSVHESHLHWRNNDSLKSSKKARKESTWQDLQKKRRKKLLHLHNSRNNTLRLGPWQASQFSI